MGETYTQRLKHLKWLQLPVEEPWARQVYWMYGLVVDESTGLDAASLAKQLLAEGVETRPFFLGIHEQPVYTTQGFFKDEQYPVTVRIARQGLYLPSGVALTEDQLDQVCQAMEKILA
jgi:perosamine synthetase